MTSRRELLQVGLAGGMLLPLASFEARLRAASAVVYKAVFDERFARSVAFARQLALHGTSVQGIRGDVTALWYHDLYFRWRRGPTQVVGMTTSESLFCLEILARDAGHQVTLRETVDDDLVSWSLGPRVSAF